jgi:hypothetical protein
MEERDHFEAQYWWAFSCLVLAGRRGPSEFHAELMRRTACSFPTPEEVEATVDEAVGYLSDVLNAGLYDEVPKKLFTSGWKRHLLALATLPENDKVKRGSK